MLLDLRNFGITGKDFEKKLDEVYITVNKNAIPNDPQSPFITSGVRVGTPAVTSRGFVEADMEKIAEFFYLTATDFDNKADEIDRVPDGDAVVGVGARVEHHAVVFGARRVEPVDDGALVVGLEHVAHKALRLGVRHDLPVDVVDQFCEGRREKLKNYVITIDPAGPQPVRRGGRGLPRGGLLRRAGDAAALLPRAGKPVVRVPHAGR